MAELDLDNVVRRVTVIENSQSGITSTRELQIKKPKQKKGSDAIERPRRMVRRVARAIELGAKDYIRRFDRSNRQKKDGWARDHLVNLQRSYWRGVDSLD